MPAFVLVLVAALALAAAPAAAQAPQPPAAAAFAGRPVSEVSVIAEGRPVTDASLLNLIETPAGQPLSIAAVRETLTHLFNIGRFQGIEVHADAGANGTVTLQYRLTPLHAVSDIQFAGDTGLSSGELRRVVTERYGRTPPAGRADAAARTLEQHFAQKGYLRARVTPSVDRSRPERTVLRFNVEAGPRARIGTVEIEGAAQPEAIAERLDLAAGEPFDQQRLTRRLDDYVQSLRRRGYYEAAADQRSRPRDGDQVVDVTVRVSQGPLVTLRFEGDPLPRNRVAELVPVEREGTVDEDLLEDSEIRIENFLREQGYRDAEVTHDRTYGDGTETVTFTVKRGPRFVVGAVEISGNASVDIEALRDLVALQRGDPFVTARLDAAANAIKALYLQRGYREAAVDAAISEPAAGEVIVRLVVREGVLTRVGPITIEGNQAIAADALRGALRVNRGDVFYAPAIAADREALQRAYLNQGYASATVEVVPVPNADNSVIGLTYRITEGARVIVDHVIIVGNTKTSEETIRRELLIEPGKPLGYDDLIESQRRLSALGLFRRVRFTEIAHRDSPRRDIIVTVEEANRTTLVYGGGVEASTRAYLDDSGTSNERIEVAPRGSFEIGRRNLFGRNRSISLFTRFSFRPQNVAVGEQGERDAFNEYRVLTTYREIGAWGWKVDTSLTAFIEQAVRSSFNFQRRGVNGELARVLTPFVRLSGRYQLGRTELFVDERIPEDDQLDIDRLFPQVRISSLSGAVYRDTRDDPLDPTRGVLIGSDTELAPRALGSEVGFAKTFVQAFGFRSLSRSRRIVLAGAARIGLARGFERTVEGTTTDVDLPASERFFAGGSTTVRGFALDKLGAPETISETGFALGGNAVLVLNAELRTTLWRDLGLVGFLDIGNVFARVSDLDFSELRVSPGLGLRYQSPIGPVRLDVGFKVDPRELSPGRFEARSAIHISVGHAF